MSWILTLITRINAQVAALPTLSEGAMLLGRDSGGTARRLFILGGKDGASWAAADTPPVGFVYIQGANDVAPATLWPGTTWADVSSEEAGRYRRMKGTYSPPNGGSMGVSTVGETQNHAMMGHYHPYYYAPTGNYYAGSSWSLDNGASAGSTAGGASRVRSPSNDGTHGDPSTVLDYENRPATVGVAKWRRTA